MYNIGIIGTGKFGYSFGKLLSKEYQVSFSDKNESIVRKLSSELTITNDNKKIIENSDVIFVCVDTPITNNKEFNTLQISNIVDNFIECFKSEISINGKTLIIVSTVNSFTTKLIQERLSAYGVQVAYLPTFVEYTNIGDEIINTPFFLLGNSNHEITSMVTNILTNVIKKPINIQQMGYTASELTKIMIDGFSTVQKTFINGFKDIFEKFSLSHEFTMSSDSLNKEFRKNNPFISDGKPFNGPILSNINLLIANMFEQQEIDSELFLTTEKINQNRISELFIKYTNENPTKDIPFIIDGLSYMKNSNVIINSVSLDLCYKFLESGYSLNIIESESVIKSMSKSFTDSYPNKVKFFKKGLKPDGYLINF